MNAEERLPNYDRPAFPFACQGPTTGPEFYYGLTKREYFVAMAMQGIIANWGFCSTPNEQIALRSIALADAHMAGLDKVETCEWKPDTQGCLRPGCNPMAIRVRTKYCPECGKLVAIAIT